MKELQRIVKYIFRYKALVFLSIVFSVLYSSMNGFSAYLIGPFMETIFTGSPGTGAAAVAVMARGSGVLASLRDLLEKVVAAGLGSGQPQEILTRLCLMVVAVIIAKNIFSYIQGYIMAIVEQGVVRDLRNDLYASYHRLPLRFFQGKKTGDLVSRVINDCQTVNSNLNSSLINLIKEPIDIIVLLSLMLVISWQLTIVSFLVAPPSIYVLSRINRILRRRTTRTQTRISEITSVLNETISNIRVVKAFAMERFEIDKFGAANQSYFKSLIRLFWMKRLSPPVTEIIGVTIAMGVLWAGGHLVLEQRGLAPADFMKFVLLMMLLMQSAKRLTDVNVKIQVGIAATGRIFDIIYRPSEISDPPEPSEIVAIRERIRYEHVTCEYEPGVTVLQDVDLEIPAGRMFALVGSSGAGKTTIADLLPRFFDPVRGRVTIDDVDIRNFRLDDLRRLFGIVTQETILFNDSIRSNIAYGRPDISMDDLIDAAKTAYAHDFIMKLERGYDTIIGDRGTKLSGGQKQRLVIARAIVKNPPFLIFDEATSALDSESEAEVQAAIDRLLIGRTSLIIAHRLSTIKKADTIVVLDNGRIVETGTHQELYEKGGMYRRLNDLQIAPASER